MSQHVAEKVLEILGNHAAREVLAARPRDELYLASLGLSSADMINIVIEVEDAFDIEVDDARIHQLKTVGELVRAVEERIAAAGSA